MGRLIAEQIGIPKTIMRQNLSEDLQKQNLCVRFVLHALTLEQKEECLNHTYDHIEMIKSEQNFSDSIITGDEIWCFAYVTVQGEIDLMC